MCSKEFGTRTIKYLSCPEVQFNDNNKGYVIKSRNYFEWRISSDTLFINSSDLKKGETIFEDSIYLIAFNQKTEYMELRLKSISDGGILVLGR
jgi:hypothetical protein